MPNLKNIYRLGVKEMWSLLRNPMMLMLILYSFSLDLYVAATAVPDSIAKAAIAVVDEDNSPFSAQLLSAFQMPYFMPPTLTTSKAMDEGMDHGTYTFGVDIPPNFQRDLLAGRSPQIQLNVDATQMSQAFTGNGYISQIISTEVNQFLSRQRTDLPQPVDLDMRIRYNPNLVAAWFSAINEVVNNITMLSIILVGAAVLREREEGTMEHILAMPVAPSEIMLSKVLSMGLVVFLATLGGVVGVIQFGLQVPITTHSLMLFMGCTVVFLLSTTALGIFLATLSRSMPQFAILMVLVLLPLQMLSGGATPRESMPEVLQYIMLVAPTTHFVSAAQATLLRNAGMSTIWPQFLSITAITAVLFFVSLVRFRKSTTDSGG
ncbi:ABC transporter permease [Curvibacter sp. RS43]|jgi:ABC-2 type transport system permease protein|uniref:ABC transporter permease n=1 Tax=Curvibacter microcysteis TaxID=3026419 RepID=A0ABT5MKU1_9BURK|nr:MULTISPECIES: ABC transporter permease [unclassified Curvibacter]MDD0810487.1 ABC transporter permease [Curvibacter sp. RS43]MDD0815776.1 ABC transporter permease [Curvibacter sp. HBC28]